MLHDRRDKAALLDKGRIVVAQAVRMKPFAEVSDQLRERLSARAGGRNLERSHEQPGARTWLQLLCGAKRVDPALSAGGLDLDFSVADAEIMRLPRRPCPRVERDLRAKVGLETTQQQQLAVQSGL